MAREIRFKGPSVGNPTQDDALFTGTLPKEAKPQVYKATAFEDGKSSETVSFVIGEPLEGWDTQKWLSSHCMLTLHKFQENLVDWFALYETFYNLIWYHGEVGNDDDEVLKTTINNHEKYAKTCKWVGGFSYGGTQAQMKTLLDLAFNSPSVAKTGGKVWVTAYNFNPANTQLIKYYVEQAGYSWDDIYFIPDCVYKDNPGDGTQAQEVGYPNPRNQQMAGLLFEENEIDGDMPFMPSLDAQDYRRKVALKYKKISGVAIGFNYSSIQYHHYGAQVVIYSWRQIMSLPPAERVKLVNDLTANDYKEQTGLMPANDIGLAGLSSMVVKERGMYVGQSLDIRIPYTNQDGILWMTLPYREAYINNLPTVTFDRIRVFAGHMLHYSNAEPRKDPHRLFLNHAKDLANGWQYTVAANPYQYPPSANSRANNKDVIEIVVQLPTSGYKVRYGSWTSDVLPAGDHVFVRPIAGYSNQKIVILQGSKIVWTGYTDLPVEMDPSIGQWGISVREVNPRGLPTPDAPKWKYDKKTGTMILTGNGPMEVQIDHDYWEDYKGPYQVTGPLREQYYKGRIKGTDKANPSAVGFSPKVS